MDKKILAVIAVIIIIVAGAGAYLVLNQNGESHNNAHAIILDGVEPTEDNVVNNTYEIPALLDRPSSPRSSFLCPRTR